MKTSYKHWNEQQKSLVADGLCAGLSASQIGRELDVSRSAILGVVYRDEALKSIGFARSKTGVEVS